VPATRADTSSTERRRVVLVGDAEHGSALYWLPVVAFAWKNIALYEPLVLLVRARSQGPPSASAEEGALHVVAQSLEALGIDFEVVDRASSLPARLASVPCMAARAGCSLERRRLCTSCALARCG
jgi:hypothetical protein